MGGGVLMKALGFWVGQGGDHRSPWEVEMRDGHKQTEISVVETIGGHGRWSTDEGTGFLSKLTIKNWSIAIIYHSSSMGGGDVVEMVEMYLQNKYTKTPPQKVIIAGHIKNKWRAIMAWILDLFCSLTVWIIDTKHYFPIIILIPKISCSWRNGYTCMTISCVNTSNKQQVLGTYNSDGFYNHFVYMTWNILYMYYNLRWWKILFTGLD